MPNPNVGQRVAQAWDAYMAGKPEDTISDDYGELRRKEKSKKAFTGGGDDILGAIEYKLNDSFAFINDTGTVSTTRVDVFDEYTFPWRQAGMSTVQSTFEDAINRGESKKFDLLAGKLENMRVAMRSNKSTYLFTAQSGIAPFGYPDLVASDPTTGTVGGINRANFSFWRNQTEASAGSNFDQLRADMRLIHAACSKGQGIKEPDYYVSTSTVVNGYEALLIANERVVSKEDSQADAGFKSTAFKFKQSPVYWDRDCAASTMYALRNDDPQIVVQSGVWFKLHPAVDPANQFLEVYKMESIYQLVVKNPRHLGVLTSIA